MIHRYTFTTERVNRFDWKYTVFYDDKEILVGYNELTKWLAKREAKKAIREYTGM